MIESNKQKNPIVNRASQPTDDQQADRLADLLLIGEQAEAIKGAKRMHKPLVITKELDKS
jgi:hypothetical protein